MIQIGKKEAQIVRNEFPHVAIKKTVHKYYMEEDPAAMKRIGKEVADGVKANVYY